MGKVSISTTDIIYLYAFPSFYFWEKRNIQVNVGDIPIRYMYKMGSRGRER